MQDFSSIYILGLKMSIQMRCYLYFNDKVIKWNGNIKCLVKPKWILIRGHQVSRKCYLWRLKWQQCQMSIAASNIFQFPLNWSAKFVLIPVSTIFSSLLFRCIFDNWSFWWIIFVKWLFSQFTNSSVITLVKWLLLDMKLFKNIVVQNTTWSVNTLGNNKLFNL